MPSLRALRPLAPVLVSACLVATPVVAATIRATAEDVSGKTVAGVVLTLRDAADRQVSQQTTDATGVASFVDVPGGRYTLRNDGDAVIPPRSLEVRPDQTLAIVVAVGAMAPPDVKLEVSATRLKEARIALSPKIGTTIYTLDQEHVAQYGAGEDTPMNDVLLRLPGVAQDSKASGSLHVRDEHANVQYRINGIQLPEGISGFGQSVDARFADRIDFVTGALPAQYGLRTAGIVDIETKDGSFIKPGGSIGLYAGGYDTIEPSVEVVGSHGATSYYATANYLSDSLGIENPLPTTNAIHDWTQQARGFGYLSYLPNDDTRVGLMAGAYRGRFQIPNNPDQTPAYALAGVSDPTTGFNARPSAELDQRQHEENYYLIASLQQTLGRLDYQASLFYQYSTLHYFPDSQGGDLIYNGVSSDVFKSNSAVGLQADASYRLVADHTIRFGTAYTHQLTESDNQVQTFPTDPNGNQVGNEPITILDTSSQGGKLTSLYIQDEWRIDPRITVNYGVPLRPRGRVHRRTPVQPADQRAVEGDRRHGAARRICAVFHATAAGAGRANEHRPIRGHDGRPGGPGVRYRQVRANELFRRRLDAHDHPGLDGRRRLLLQAHHQHARRRTVRPGIDPHAIQLRRRPGARHRILDDVLGAAMERLPELRDQQGQGQGHRFRPVALRGR